MNRLINFDKNSLLLLFFLLFTLVLNAVFGVRDTIVGNVMKFATLAIIIFKNINSLFPSTSFLRTFLILFTLLVTLQLAVFHNIVSVKILLGAILFVFFSRCSSIDYLQCVVSAIKIAAILMTLNALYALMVHGNVQYFSFRQYTWLDKSFYTSIYAFTYAFCLLDILHRKKILLNLVLLLICLATNVFLVQSKTSLFTVVFSFAAIWFCGDIDIKENNRAFIKYAILASVIFLILFPSVVLPDEIKLGINKLINYNLFAVDIVGNMNRTYDMRDLIWAFCIDLWSDHPVMGIGFGNYGNYIVHADELISDVGEEESSFLQIMVEGGLIYFFIMLYFFYNILSKAITFAKQYQDYYSFIPLLLFLNFTIIIIGNDFIDLFFWISCGIMYGYIENYDCENYNI